MSKDKSFGGGPEKYAYEQRRRAKAGLIIGTVMIVVPVVIDWVVYKGLGRTMGDIGEGMHYGFLAGFILFPVMIVGIILFVLNFYRYIKWRNG